MIFKKILFTMSFLLLLLSLMGCGAKNTDKLKESQTVTESLSDNATEKDNITAIDNNEASYEDTNMNLYINETNIPVTWEDNDTVKEIRKEALLGDIVISMSMYSDFEQVGPLGKTYTRNDSQTTTLNGDIVLYSGNQIVVFYGSNTWAYTRLGKMNLSEEDVIKLLSNGDVTLRISSR
jgi:predicted small lipoprotein YifL